MQPISMQAVSKQPIQDIGTTGIHWINASAGTGKTYTLSSVLVRLLIEKYLPKQIIVTTFTRKAANELKVRVRARLQETLSYLYQVDVLNFEQQLAHEQDLLYIAILQGFSPDFIQRDLNYCIERLKFILNVLDELYIGTLDSFTQKILREFSFESGQLQQVKISEEENLYIQQILHDRLRAWIEQQPLNIIQVLHQARVIKPVDDYLRLVQSSLNFSSAKWQKVEQPRWVDFDIYQTYQQLSEQQFDDLITLMTEKDLHGADLKKWVVLREILQQKTWHDYSEDDLTDLLTKNYRFTKSTSDACKQHLFWQYKQHCAELSQNFNRMIEQYTAYLQYELIQAVQQQLPERMQMEQETTFATQVQSLANVLHGEQGEKFAQLVHQRYPVILVDEFQDTNYYQDTIVHTIWRHPARYQHGCCIMVGDDKQAIYGFRGGDMLTYNHARHEVVALYEHEQKSKQKQQVFFYTLSYNHRTIPQLVSAVDALFQRNVNFGEEVIYQPIEAGNRPHDILVEHQNGEILHNHKPLRWLDLEQAKQENDDISPYASKDIDQIVWQIQQLLAKSQRGEIYFQSAKNQQQRPVSVNDIAVLVTSNNDADKLSYALNRLGIPCLSQSNKSVFDSPIARDVAHVLSAILQPYKEDKIKRALMTQLFVHSISKIKQLEADNKISDYMQAFDQMKQNWQQYGFLNAWQQFLSQHHIWQNLMYAQPYERERLVTNLRHLSDILAHYSLIYNGQNHLLSWYQKQVNEPQSREWEMERKLSQAQGVQLLTIHKSKGLEFKIVFCVSQKSLSNRDTLTYAISDDLQREIIIDQHKVNEQQKQQDLERTLSENHRLWYVALTRASYRLYMCVEHQDAQKNPLVGVNYWRLSGDELQHNDVMYEPLLLNQPEFYYQQYENRSQTLQAKEINTYLPREISKTSFTALTMNQMHRSHDNLSQNTQFDDGFIAELADENVAMSDDSATNEPLDEIKRLFPRGKIAGTQLHQLFEKIDIQQAASWESEIQRLFKQDYQLVESALWMHYQQQFAEHAPEQALDEQQLTLKIKHQFTQELCDWIQQVVETPLVNQMSLAHIPPCHRLMELQFYLALKEDYLSIRQLQKLFAEYGLDIQLNEQRTARYLEGAIDMVFFDGQRYHILDYKSNYLGDNLNNYQRNQLYDDMTKHQYWLQASIYLLAVHRYLKAHLKGYDISQHLGTAHYAYLRGMTGSAGQGVFSWKPDDAFILKLDDILGYRN